MNKKQQGWIRIDPNTSDTHRSADSVSEGSAPTEPCMGGLARAIVWFVRGKSIVPA